MKYILLLAMMLVSSPALANYNTANIDDNEAVLVGYCYDNDGWCNATLNANGDFGGGTIAWEWSIDGGTTKNDIKDETQVAVTSTAAGQFDDTFTVQFGNGRQQGKSIGIWATMSGATSPDVDVMIMNSNY